MRALRRVHTYVITYDPGAPSERRQRDPTNPAAAGWLDVFSADRQGARIHDHAMTSLLPYCNNVPASRGLPCHSVSKLTTAVIRWLYSWCLRTPSCRCRNYADRRRRQDCCCSRSASAAMPGDERVERTKAARSCRSCGGSGRVSAGHPSEDRAPSRAANEAEGVRRSHSQDRHLHTRADDPEGRGSPAMVPRQVECVVVGAHSGWSNGYGSGDGGLEVGVWARGPGFVQSSIFGYSLAPGRS